MAAILLEATRESSTTTSASFRDQPIDLRRRRADGVWRPETRPIFAEGLARHVDVDENRRRRPAAIRRDRLSSRATLVYSQARPDRASARSTSPPPVIIENDRCVGGAGTRSSTFSSDLTERQRATANKADGRASRVPLRARRATPSRALRSGRREERPRWRRCEPSRVFLVKRVRRSLGLCGHR